MCKHVAAVMYGVGSRFDRQPELLFHLREVDANELIASAGAGLPMAKQAPAPGKVLAGADLSDVFGLDMAASVEEPVSRRRTVKAARKTAPKPSRKRRKD
jgi:uncharacterized Zn finger protein